ncbi:hypothetical protein D3C79_846810 [compost metagenome]
MARFTSLTPSSRARCPPPGWAAPIATTPTPPRSSWRATASASSATILSPRPAASRACRPGSTTARPTITMNRAAPGHSASTATCRPRATWWSTRAVTTACASPAPIWRPRAAARMPVPPVIRTRSPPGRPRPSTPGMANPNGPPTTGRASTPCKAARALPLPCSPPCWRTRTSPP